MRWKNCGKYLEWNTCTTNDDHHDYLEMAGLGAAFIVTYGTSGGKLQLDRHIVFPTLRTIPNNTHASYQYDIAREVIPELIINGSAADENAVRFVLDGNISAESEYDGATIVRTFFPSVSRLAAYELITVTALRDITVSMDGGVRRCAVGRGTKGVYIGECVCCGGEKALKSGESTSFALCHTCRIANVPLDDSYSSVEFVFSELTSRAQRISELTEPLTLTTGNEDLDTMFFLSKIRAGESIFKTMGGLLHSPGGRSYYAATWCNDQIEYSGPFFAYTGDRIELEAALNAYREYIPFMSDEWISIPSSVIAEGNDIWEKDRGDEAMFAYGASLYALTRGDRKIAEELYPAIRWCIEFCRRRRSPEGIIISQTDELEGRFPSGEANLSTSSLCLGGMKLASYLARDLGHPEDSETLNAYAAELETAIENYFGTTDENELHGFRTYRYYKGNTTLRSWICLPLCMGMTERLEGTVAALTSPYLWTEDGLLSEEGSTTVWDRSTLYGFRGAFQAGAGDYISKYFFDYIETRLRGERVPYAIEAYPEGDKRHLSGESSLFCRIITDGILGISPRGLHSFSLTPRLPLGIDTLRLENIRAFGAEFLIHVSRAENRATIISGGKTYHAGLNETATIVLE